MVRTKALREGVTPAPKRSRAMQPLNGRLTDRLGIAIVTGVHKPGSTLPNEMKASEGLHVSRNAYREAIRVLAAKGLVTSRTKTGTKVNPRRQWNILDPSVLAWMFAREPDLKFIKGLFELRRIVEPAAAALAAERRTSAALARMGHALEEMVSHGLQSEIGRDADERFHQSILEATDNETLAGLTATISSAIRWTTIFKYNASSRPRDPIPAHRALFAAIADSDAKAARTAAISLVDQAFDDIHRLL